MALPRALRPWLVPALCWWCVGCKADAPKDEAAACNEAATDVYRQRIEPVLMSDQPASCNQCHLSGVDLGLFVRDTPCETMACLVERGLVDLHAPRDSTILSWIERASPDSELITDQVIQAEYDAFAAWIEQVASCGACADTTCGEKTGFGFCDAEAEPGEPYSADRDPGGCDSKTLEQVFLDTIYVTRGRCYPCHFVGAKPTPDALQWLVQQDNCGASALASLNNAVANGLIDTEDPLSSLLLLKPLAQKDGGVLHGGHSKITKENDPAYTNFVYFLERYAGCAQTGAGGAGGAGAD
ncbi:MAG TPA: hypothetical protein VI197_31725 [Polyangiaceae bacterium]